MALYNYKIPVIIKKTTLHSVLVNHGKTLQIFSRTFQDIQTQFKDFPGQQKKISKTFSGCGNPGISISYSKMFVSGSSDPYYGPEWF